MSGWSTRKKVAIAVGLTIVLLFTGFFFLPKMPTIEAVEFSDVIHITPYEVAPISSIQTIEVTATGDKIAEAYGILTVSGTYAEKIEPYYQDISDKSAVFKFNLDLEELPKEAVEASLTISVIDHAGRQTNQTMMLSHLDIDKESAKMLLGYGSYGSFSAALPSFAKEPEYLIHILYILRDYDPIAQSMDIVKKVSYNNVTIGYEEAVCVFLARLLYVEKNHLVPWTVANYSVEENRALFTYEFDSPAFDSDTKTRRLVDAIAAFPLALKLIGNSGTQLEATIRVVEWAETNFFHASTVYGWEVYGNLSNGLRRAWESDKRASIEDRMRERVVGCHASVFLLKALLTSVNIPTKYFMLEGHGVAFFPSLNLYVHGDYIADLHVVPGNLLLMNNETLCGYALSERGYMSFEDELFYRRPNGVYMEIRRDGNFLWMYAWVEDPTEEYVNFLKQHLRQFNPKFLPYGNRLKIEGERIPIKGLYDLINDP